MADDGGDILLFPKIKEGADAITPPAEKKPRPLHGDCLHRRKSILDQTAHQLICADCDQVLDPFDWISDYVGRWDRENTFYRQARQQGIDAAKRLAELERLERNTKARIRRGGLVISPGGARAALDQLRALNHLLTDMLREEGNPESFKKAEARMRLWGYRPEDGRRALRELSALCGLEEPPVEAMSEMQSSMRPAPDTAA